MEVALHFILVAFISYFIGTINFSKIISWNARRKDITKIGSHNPGTMNMLRSFGFGLALATFIAEVIKVGLTCLVFKLIYPQYDQVIYFFAGLFLMLGNDFPVWSKFKGGKGVACIAGIFLFSNLWYVALGWFVVCFVLLLLIDIGSVISFTYIGGLSIAYTIYIWVLSVPYAWAITAMIWFMFVVTIIKHHANIARLFKGTENHVGFKEKIKRFFNHNKGEMVIDEELVEQKSPEKEIVIDPNNPQNTNEENNVDKENEEEIIVEVEEEDNIESEQEDNEIIVDDNLNQEENFDKAQENQDEKLSQDDNDDKR